MSPFFLNVDNLLGYYKNYYVRPSVRKKHVYIVLLEQKIKFHINYITPHCRRCSFLLSDQGLWHLLRGFYFPRETWPERPNHVNWPCLHKKEQHVHLPAVRAPYVVFKAELSYSKKKLLLTYFFPLVTISSSDHSLWSENRVFSQFNQYASCVVPHNHDCA